MRQGRTDAWIAHQLEVSVGDIRSFKREHELVPDEGGNGDDGAPAGMAADELDLRAEDDALVAAALEAEQERGPRTRPTRPRRPTRTTRPATTTRTSPSAGRRGRRGGRGRRRKPKALEGTFDHGDEGYGLWLDPAIQDDPVYAEHWAGHRPVTVSVEPERIVISRAGEEAGDDDDSED